MNVYTNTFLGTYIYISPPKGTFEDQIPFLPGGQVSFLQGIWFELGRFWMVLA